MAVPKMPTMFKTLLTHDSFCLSLFLANERVPPGGPHQIPCFLHRWAKFSLELADSCQNTLKSYTSKVCIK